MIAFESHKLNLFGCKFSTLEVMLYYLGVQV